MKKTPVAAVILSLMLTAGLSACAVELVEPSSSPTPDVTSPSPEATGGTEVGGEFTSGDCAGKDLELTQDETVVVLTGRCGAVSVTGDGIAVNLENTDSITVGGTENTVVVTGDAGAVTMDGTYNFYTGSTVATMEIPGSNNTVTANALDTVSLTGSANFVTWTDGASSASDTGTGNTIAH